MLSAPFSEHYGRKIVYITSAPMFMLFTMGAGLAKSLGTLIVCRFFAGMTGSPALAVGAGTVADLFLPHQRAVVSSIFLMAPFMGPSLGYVACAEIQVFQLVFCRHDTDHIGLLWEGLLHNTKTGDGHNGVSSLSQPPCFSPHYL
jgi:MFS family permease